MLRIARVFAVVIVGVWSSHHASAAEELPVLGFVAFGDTTRLNDIRSADIETLVGRPSGAPEGRVARVALVGGSFVSAGEIFPTATGSGAEFGIAVDLDGDLLAVGEGRGAASVGSGTPGVARVFERIAGTWVESSLLLSPMSQASEWFGQRTAVAGGAIAVAAPGWQSNQGRVYIYRKVGTAWPLQGSISAFDGSAFDNFGYSVDGAPGLLGNL